MTKLKKTILLLTLSIIIFQPILTKADIAGVGNVTFQVNPPEGFDDTIVVEINSNSTPGYDEPINKIVELQSSMFYLSAVQGIPAGFYSVRTHLYKKDDPDKKEYKNPDYYVNSSGGFQLLTSQNYELKLDILPTVTLGAETAPPFATIAPDEPEEEPSLTPEPTPKGENNIAGLLWDVFKRSWFTVILLIVAGGIWGFIAIRKSIYKE